MSIYTGFRTLAIGKDGLPADHFTGWAASCLIILGMIIYIGEVVEDCNEQSHRARIRR